MALKVWLGGCLRRAVLWITGRDLMEPTLLSPKWGDLMILGPPTSRWEMTLSADAYLKFMLPTGPNVLHRMMQRLVLGIRWRMLPKTPNEKAEEPPRSPQAGG